jgi:hypothetical protein
MVIFVGRNRRFFTGVIFNEEYAKWGTGVLKGGAAHQLG